jgi:hexokinase
LTQIEVESRTKIDRSALSLFEHEYRTPTEAQARLLIRVLSAAIKDRVKEVSKVAAQAERLDATA